VIGDFAKFLKISEILRNLTQSLSSWYKSLQM